ncbi:MAG: hypothetical protein L6R41_008076 [Letrouitia leprolyta]|nr:MAG: hypothetical protein L6R41_008076 [Letrouitia leprolyta]
MDASTNVVNQPIPSSDFGEVILINDFIIVHVAVDAKTRQPQIFLIMYEGPKIALSPALASFFCGLHRSLDSFTLSIDWYNVLAGITYGALRLASQCPIQKMSRFRALSPPNAVLLHEATQSGSNWRPRRTTQPERVVSRAE